MDNLWIKTLQAYGPLAQPEWNNTFTPVDGMATLLDLNRGLFVINIQVSCNIKPEVQIVLLYGITGGPWGLIDIFR